MPKIDISTGFKTAGQFPWDYKLYIKELSTLTDLGVANQKAYSYYKDMIVFCVETRKEYIWSEKKEGEAGLLSSDFTYPANVITEGIDYSNKIYNFYEYFSVDTNNQRGELVDHLLLDDKIYRGNIIWRNGTMKFDSSNFMFAIGGEVYTPIDKEHTLQNSDNTYGRIDIFVVDSVSGQVEVITGTPSITPEEPAIIFGRQLRVSSVFIPANSPIPEISEGVSFDGTTISDEIDSGPFEWESISHTSNINITDTSAASSGVKSVRVLPAPLSEAVWKSETGMYDYAINEYLLFDLKLDAPLIEYIFGSGNIASVIKIRLSNSIDGFGKTVFGRFSNNKLITSGFNNNSTDWQSVGISMEIFDFYKDNVLHVFDQLTLTFENCPPLYIDNIRIADGLTKAITGRLGDKNVQTDWDQDDISSDDYLRNKPEASYMIQGYLVWKGTGVRDRNRIRQGNIVFGRGSIISDLIMGEATKDDPANEDDFNMIGQTL